MASRVEVVVWFMHAEYGLPVFYPCIYSAVFTLYLHCISAPGSQIHVFGQTCYLGRLVAVVYVSAVWFVNRYSCIVYTAVVPVLVYIVI